MTDEATKKEETQNSTESLAVPSKFPAPPKTPGRKTLLEGLKNGEKWKSWGAFLLGVAALITALSAWRDPNAESKVKEAAYDAIKLELEQQAKDDESMANDIEYLFMLRQKDEQATRENAELLRSHDDIEEMYLKQYLTKKYGTRYAREFMERREKLRKEMYTPKPTDSTRKQKSKEIDGTSSVPPYESVKKRALKK